MNRLAPRLRLLAAGLSGLAGFVDAIGFISLGGFFVSFMSGNTTRMAVGLAAGVHDAVIAAGLIGLFVLGVMAGTLVRRGRISRVLALVALLLAVAALCGSSGFPFLAAAAMALAMGAENTVFERDGEVHVGLTYMTGTLVKLGQSLTAALLGKGDGKWPSYLLLWLGLVAGAVLGALVWPHLHWHALWLASAAAALAALMAARLADVRHSPH